MSKVKLGNEAKRVSLHTIERMSVYRKVLEELSQEGVENIFSHQLAELVGVTAAQLRRDLATFGSFGSISTGYPVRSLIQTISNLLGTENLQNVVLVGVGNLGQALLSYRGFEERGFHISVAFDIDQEKVGKIFTGRRCYHIRELETILPYFVINMAILACRPDNLQEIINRLGKAGIHSILNFVPKHVNAPEGVYLEDVDLSAKLEKLSFLNKLTNP
ncbi:MAG: redox-sensing transcriptional repressor Rex [Smithellaceae bacterium]|nr:redox-sensing transcriptional repressor Rex [Smithellaceae bacterium]